jgi:hypothetical protein
MQILPVIETPLEVATESVYPLYPSRNGWGGASGFAAGDANSVAQSSGVTSPIDSTVVEVELLKAIIESLEARQIKAASGGGTPHPAARGSTTTDVALQDSSASSGIQFLAGLVNAQAELAELILDGGVSTGLVSIYA